MALASETVEAVFRRLLARYGNAWNAKWAGVPAEDVKADWGRVLGHARRDAVLYALENLPEFVPTAHQFREVCARAPVPKPEQLQLDAPKPDPARLAAELTRLHDLLVDRKPLDWAFELQDRESKGEVLSEVQRIAWRNALASPAAPVQGTSYAFLDEELPPAMRRREVNPADVEYLEQQTRERLYAKRGSAYAASHPEGY